MEYKPWKYKSWKYKPRAVGHVAKETSRWRVSTRGAFIRVHLYGWIFIGGYINRGNINHVPLDALPRRRAVGASLHGVHFYGCIYTGAFLLVDI